MIGLRGSIILLARVPDMGPRTSTSAWVAQWVLTRPDGLREGARAMTSLVRRDAYLLFMREPGTLGIPDDAPASIVVATEHGPVDADAPTLEPDGELGTTADLIAFGGEG